MIKLHGIALSNYYNMVKTALLEKNISFEEVFAPPSQDLDYLSKSVMGKIPCIETKRGFLAETHAILDYLEESQPSPALLPTDPFDRAKVRELVQSLELYIELVARRGYGVFFGKPVSENVKVGLKTDLEKGIAAVGKLAKCAPWIAGNQFTYADIVGYWTFTTASTSAKINADLNLLSQIPGAKEWYKKVGERDSIKSTLAEYEAAVARLKK